MPPVVLAVSLSKITAPSFGTLVQKSVETTIDAATPGHLIYVYVYGLDKNFSVVTDGRFKLDFPVRSITDLTGVFSSLFGSVKELKVVVPESQVLSRWRGGRHYGPVLFTKIKVVNQKNGTSNLWPLCILMNVPTILGVTQEQVISATTNKPADVYKDLLKKNLTNLVKGTKPGAVRHGTAVEDPDPNVYIYGCNFSQSKVKPTDLPTVDKLPYSTKKGYPRTICTVEFDFSIGPLRKKFRFDLQEIGVWLPTMADLQNSGNYLPNSILMAFGVQVVNDGGNGETSNTWEWPMWLPMPSMTDLFPRNKIFGNGNHLASEDSPHDNGEVRWYLGNPVSDQKRPLTKYDQRVPDELQKIQRIPYEGLSQAWNFTVGNLLDEKTIVLPSEIINILSDIREAGELCEVDDKNYDNPWTDDTLWFHPPSESCFECTCGYVYDPELGDPDSGIDPWIDFKDIPVDWACPNCGNGKSQFVETDDKRPVRTGFVVVWRGDIPSLPLPVNLIGYALGLARRLWRPIFGNGMGTHDIPISIPVGEAIQFGIERLEDTVNNELVGYIGLPAGLQVTFAFLADAPSGSSFDEDSIRDKNNLKPSYIGTSVDNGDFLPIEPGHKGIDISKILEFKYKPQITSKDLTDNESGAFTLQLTAFISGDVTILGYQIHINPIRIEIGPKLRFHPQPLKIPTVAIFFVDRHFENRFLIAIPSSVGLDEVKIDAQTQDALGMNQSRFKFINALGQFNNLLAIFNKFENNSEIDTIVNWISRICDVGGSLISVTDDGSIDDLGEYCLAKPDQLGFGGSSFSGCISSAVLIGPPHKYSETTVICWEKPLSVDEADRGRRLELQIPDKHFVYTVDDFRYVVTIPEVVEGVGFGEPNGFNDAVSGIEFKED